MTDEDPSSLSTPPQLGPAMLPLALLQLGTGTLAMLGLMGLFALIGLVALARSQPPEPSRHEGVHYVYGLGKHPRLLIVPGNREIPATMQPLGGKGLRRLAADADTKSRFTVDRYKLPDGRRAPYKLSEDLPEGIQAVEFVLEDVRVWVNRDGELSASRTLTEDERMELENLMEDHVDWPPRADRRTWSPPQHTPKDANVKRA